MPTLAAIIDQLANHPDYRHHGPTNISDRVHGYAAAALGVTPDELPDTVSDGVAESVRFSFVIDETDDDEPAQAADAPLPAVSASDRAAWDSARQRARQRVRDETERLENLRREVGAIERLRDQSIRTAVLLGVNVADVADDANLKPARIYQIRDGRR